MIRHLQAVDYAARTKVFAGERVEHVTFNFTLENQIHRGGQYFNDKYAGWFHISFPHSSYFLLVDESELKTGWFRAKPMYNQASLAHCFEGRVSVRGVSHHLGPAGSSGCV